MYCLLIHPLSIHLSIMPPIHPSIEFSKGESLLGGYSLYTGMMCDNGEVVIIYEWTLPCKPAKRTDTRRIKQVTVFMPVFLSACLFVSCLSVCLSVCLSGCLVHFLLTGCKHKTRI